MALWFVRPLGRGKFEGGVAGAASFRSHQTWLPNNPTCELVYARASAAAGDDSRRHNPVLMWEAHDVAVGVRSGQLWPLGR